jgi:hypothetical protein
MAGNQKPTMPHKPIAAILRNSRKSMRAAGASVGKRKSSVPREGRGAEGHNEDSDAVFSDMFTEAELLERLKQACFFFFVFRNFRCSGAKFTVNAYLRIYVARIRVCVCI